MRKPVVALAASAGVFTVVAAGAATLSVTGFVPQFGNVSNSCDTNGVTVTPHVQAVDVAYYNYDTYQTTTEVYQSVTSVTVSGIASQCAGQELAVSISNDDAQHYVATSVATIDDSGSATVTFDAQAMTGSNGYPDMYIKYITDIDVTIAGDVVPSNNPV